MLVALFLALLRFGWLSGPQSASIRAGRAHRGRAASPRLIHTPTHARAHWRSWSCTRVWMSRVTPCVVVLVARVGSAAVPLKFAAFPAAAAAPSPRQIASLSCDHSAVEKGEAQCDSKRVSDDQHHATPTHSAPPQPQRRGEEPPSHGHSFTSRPPPHAQPHVRRQLHTHITCMRHVFHCACIAQQ